jgi:hypothetical protein
VEPLRQEDSRASIAGRGDRIDGTGQRDWVRAHELLSALARERANLEGREALALLRALRAGVHRHLGFGSFAEYVERLFGYGARTTEDKLRTAEALEGLPVLERALQEGRVRWSAARELVRVATSATENEWLEAVEGRTVREIELLVSGRARGDRPGDAERSEARKHVLRFEVSAETLATFREALRKVSKESGERLDDDAALLLMARAIVRASDADAGRASYQLAVSLCECCRRSFQRAGAEELELEPVVAEMVCCDAQRVEVPSTHVGGAQVQRARATQTVPPALRREVVLRDHGRCVVPGCRHTTFVDVHHIQARADEGAHDADNLVVLCGAHHRAVHRGKLWIYGSPSSALGFQHADGSAYGQSVSAAAVEIRERVLRGLIQLGFRERQAQSALQKVRAAPDATTPEGLLRSALQVLTSSVRPRPF